MATLTPNLKGQYFDQIKSGEKTEEYRLCKPFWAKRLEGRHYDLVIICRGYPARGDQEKRFSRPYVGYEVKTITHPHFGPDPVEVYAIKVGNILAIAKHEQLGLLRPLSNHCYLTKGEQ